MTAKKSDPAYVAALTAEETTDPEWGGSFESYRSDLKLADLVGRTVTAIHVDPTTHEDHYGPSGNNSLYLTTDTSIFQFLTDGDCCSESWWADVFSPKQVIGGKITEAVEIDLPQPTDERGRQEDDAAYGLRIRTNKGEGRFAFRNSSNGYYGGDCTIYRVDEVPATAEAITEDWSA